MTLTLKGSQVAALTANLTLPPCSALLNAFLDEAHAERPDLRVLESLAMGDVGIAAMLLKTANFNLAGADAKVTNVKDALDVLGLKTVCLAVAVLAGRNAVGVGIKLERYWERSHLHAIICARLAKHLPNIDAETAYTFGLFNDCGIPVLAAKHADYKATLALANTSDLPFKDVENEQYGTNHTKVGALMARNWQLPDVVCRAIRDHHSPELFQGQGGSTEPEVISLCALSLVADYILANYLQAPVESDWTKHGEAALAYLGLAPEELPELMADSHDELATVRRYRG